MRRLLLCLPLCFGLAPDSSLRSHHLPGEAPLQESADLPSLQGSTEETARPKRDEPLPDNAMMDKLVRTDPIAFVENCIRRYDRTVKSYRLTMYKQERIGDELQKPELVEVAFREKPFSVLMQWKQGARRAQKTLYVEGENENKLLIRPTGLAGWLIVRRDPDGEEVLGASRYPPTEFGLRMAYQKSLDAWKEARKRGDLTVTFKGEQRLKEANNKLCWVVERTNYTRVEEGGIRRATFYFDKETWFQVGSVLRLAGESLLGEYYFRDIELNPAFEADTFTRKAL